MIQEIQCYRFECDAEIGCNNSTDTEPGRILRKAIEDVESENWLFIGNECFCPDHRPNVSDETEKA